MSNLYIKKFVDRLQHFEMRGSKDFSCSLQDAKMLHTEITRLLLDLEQLRVQPTATPDVVTVEMQGGSF
jgi:DNA-binding protein YbaB